VLLAARAAYAHAGPAALGRVLAKAGPAALTFDADLAALARLAPGTEKGDVKVASPSAAYAEGMRARLRGDLDAAVQLLAQALTGHGDACRAAGEYLVAMRLLRRPVAQELEPLRAANRECVNLTLPPPRHDPVVKDRFHDTGVRRPKR
jgi:hypothetical protein